VQEIEMGFWARLGNLWSGFLGVFMSNMESNNPAAVYEAAIEERIRDHRELKKAVAGIIYLRKKSETELADVTKDLAEVNSQLPIAVQQGEDEVALVLIQKKDQLATRVAELQIELNQCKAQADDAKQSLISFQGEIEKLKREKDQMLAKMASAEARIQVQETLDGLSTDADIQALEGVRTHIEKLQAEAEMGSELGDVSLDAKLEQIKAQARDSNAQSQLDALKRQYAAQSTESDGNKTM
jgi:phage shock protein A